MKDERLKMAYEQLPDGEGSREKLRNRILWETQAREGKPFRSEPVKTGRFAAVPALVLLIFVLGMGWLMFRRMGTEDEIIMTDPIQMITLEPSVLPTIPDMCLQYEEILSTYILAQQEQWDAAACQEAGISYLAVHGEATDKIGYLLLDMDGDGVDELLFSDGDNILDLYTVVDGEVVHLLSGTERNVYYYCVGGYIGNRGSSGAGNTSYNFYRLEDGSLVLERNVTYDADLEEVGPWITYVGGSTCGMIDSITEERAYEIIDSYVPLSLRLTGINYL